MPEREPHGTAERTYRRCILAQVAVIPASGDGAETGQTGLNLDQWQDPLGQQRPGPGGREWLPERLIVLNDSRLDICSLLELGEMALVHEGESHAHVVASGLAHNHSGRSRGSGLGQLPAEERDGGGRHQDRERYACLPLHERIPSGSGSLGGGSGAGVGAGTFYPPLRSAGWSTAASGRPPSRTSGLGADLR